MNCLNNFGAAAKTKIIPEKIGVLEAVGNSMDPPFWGVWSLSIIAMSPQPNYPTPPVRVIDECHIYYGFDNKYSRKIIIK